MFITGRFFGLVLLGAVPVILSPSHATVLWWMLVALILLVADIVAAGKPLAVELTRLPIAPIRPRRADHLDTAGDQSRTPPIPWRAEGFVAAVGGSRFASPSAGCACGERAPSSPRCIRRAAVTG